ncbi:hypothetical protein DFH06DRAFT_1145542 [Mycena polygramma]|nr:hypothetical protein DFH06DRAFT_1145542 [Mycena polygramma]
MTIFPVTNRIQSFPPELLSATFEKLDFRSATLAALTCRWWHAVAVAHTELWLTLEIDNRDIGRQDVVGRILERSRGRPVSLSLRFPATPDPIKYLMRLLKVVGGHLCHCWHLSVHADVRAWQAVLRVFAAGQTFPLLEALYLRHDDVVAQWETYSDEPPADLRFPLPDEHKLFDVQLQGVALGESDFVKMPNLDRLHLKHDYVDIMIDDGILNPWLCRHTRVLIFEGMCVPTLGDPPSADTEDSEAAPPALEHLELRELCAPPHTRVANGFTEWECVPFFRALDTSRLISLVIDTLDLEGGIWNDFIAALTGSPKFPCVTRLTLRQMNFMGMGYVHVALFLSAFPVLEEMHIFDCLQEDDSTWPDVIYALEIRPALCVGLRELDVDGWTIFRDDPMPFRDFMFSYDGPVNY